MKLPSHNVNAIGSQKVIPVWNSRRCEFSQVNSPQVRWQCSPSPLKLITSQVVEGMWFCMGISEVNGLKYIVLFLWVNMEEVGGGGCWGDYAHLACLDNQWKPMFYLILLSLNNNMIINIHSTPSHLIFLRGNWQCMWQNKCFGMLKKCRCLVHV